MPTPITHEVLDPERIYVVDRWLIERDESVPLLAVLDTDAVDAFLADRIDESHRGVAADRTFTAEAFNFPLLVIERLSPHPNLFALAGPASDEVVQMLQGALAVRIMLPSYEDARAAGGVRPSLILTVPGPAS